MNDCLTRQMLVVISMMWDDQKSNLRLLICSSSWENCSLMRFFMMMRLRVMSLRVSIFLLMSLALMNYQNLSSLFGWIFGSKLLFTCFFKLFISSICLLAARALLYTCCLFLTSSSAFKLAQQLKFPYFFPACRCFKDELILGESLPTSLRDNGGSVCLLSVSENVFLLLVLDQQADSLPDSFLLLASFLRRANCSLISISRKRCSCQDSQASSALERSICMSLRYRSLFLWRTSIQRLLDQMVYFKPSSSLISYMSIFRSDHIFIRLSLAQVIINLLTPSQSKDRISPSWSIASKFCQIFTSLVDTIAPSSNTPFLKTKAMRSQKLQQNLRE